MATRSPEAIAARLRPRVERELAELEALSRATQANRAPVELDQQSVGRLTRMDAMQKQEIAQAADRRRKAHMVRLQRALARMDEGDYGYCADCGEPIAPARLDVDPSYEKCVGCAGRD